MKDAIYVSLMTGLVMAAMALESNSAVLWW